MKEEIKKIKDFLLLNGYIEDIEGDIKSYHKKCTSSIDINKDEIVFIGDEGDWLHLPINFYAVAGAIMYNDRVGITPNRIIELEKQLEGYLNTNLIEHKFDVHNPVYYLEDGEMFKDNVTEVMIYKSDEGITEKYRLRNRDYTKSAKSLFASPEELFEGLKKNLEK